MIFNTKVKLKTLLRTTSPTREREQIRQGLFSKTMRRLLLHVRNSNWSKCLLITPRVVNLLLFSAVQHQKATQHKSHQQWTLGSRRYILWHRAQERRARGSWKSHETRSERHEKKILGYLIRVLVFFFFAIHVLCVSLDYPTQPWMSPFSLK